MSPKSSTQNTVRPTKKQQELLSYIQVFISEHGYSPSYREIMNGLNYTSVATVALHVNNLISRGHLQKRDRSARSLEVKESIQPTKIKTNDIKPSEEKWLIEKIEYFFSLLEQQVPNDQIKIDELYVLVGALKVLGMDGAAQSFIPRLSLLKSGVQ